MNKHNDKIIAMWAVVLHGKVIAMFKDMIDAQTYLDNHKRLEWAASVEHVTFKGLEII